MLCHGGRLRAAAARHGIAPERWLDLSTGINPNGWPVPAIPASAWARLPEDDDGLEQAARSYYVAEHVLPVAGSQAAIQALPRLRARSRVSMIHPGYAEHAAAWRREGHAVSLVTAGEVDASLAQTDVLVLIHPNNPTGTHFSVEQLLDWHVRLADRGGWLVIDEAFIDVTPEASLCRYSTRPGLVVLRSLGKFFGLAGARVGFVCSQSTLLEQLKAVLGPWTVSGPARWAAVAALEDRVWQEGARSRLPAEGERLQALLARHGLTPDSGCALFQWLKIPRAASVHEALARQGILTRLFARPSALRVGLPGGEEDWARLDAALRDLANVHSGDSAP